jgi:hypothetical protein
MGKYLATLKSVHNRGTPPESFLDKLVTWGRNASPEIFEPNNKQDIYVSVAEYLGPFDGSLYRRAVMLEVLRVLAGFESSWDWNCGRDTTNAESNTPCTEEAGIFQCSGNSMSFDATLKKLFRDSGGDGSCANFIVLSKANHEFSIEYCARLLRFTTRHHGPIRDKKFHSWLRRDAVKEFEQILTST